MTWKADPRRNAVVPDFMRCTKMIPVPWAGTGNPREWQRCKYRRRPGSGLCGVHEALEKKTKAKGSGRTQGGAKDES